MLYIKMKPRGYRVREIIVMHSGYPAIRYQLQCQTCMGWNAIHLFDYKDAAYKALAEWKETLA